MSVKGIRGPVLDIKGKKEGENGGWVKPAEKKLHGHKPSTKLRSNSSREGEKGENNALAMVP